MATKKNKRRLATGDVVRSEQGRDRKRYFVITALGRANGYDTAYIADGKLRKVSDRKQKNVMHISYVGHIPDEYEAASPEHMDDELISKICSKFDPAAR